MDIFFIFVCAFEEAFQLGETALCDANNDGTRGKSGATQCPFQCTAVATHPVRRSTEGSDALSVPHLPPSGPVF